jgi:hypothetical protein
MEYSLHFAYHQGEMPARFDAKLRTNKPHNFAARDAFGNKKGSRSCPFYCR